MEKTVMLKVVEREISVRRGVVDKTTSARHLKIRQFTLENRCDAPWLEHVWSVQWDMPANQTHLQRTVPFPAFNLVADRQKECALFGCSSKYFEYRLKGKGQVVGIRFRSAGQHVFWSAQASELTDGFVPASHVFSLPIMDMLNTLTMEDVDKTRIASVLTVLAQHAAPISTQADAVEQMVRLIENEVQVYQVSDLSEFFQKSERSIQRLFAKYLGLSPKQVIDRFRMHNALDTLGNDPAPDLADLALRLNYFDQSHFTNAFKQMTGFPPEKYVFQTTGGPDRNRIRKKMGRHAP